MRPETYTSTKPAPAYPNALWLIREAVRTHDGLIAGRLHDKGSSCAIGAFFDNNENLALDVAVIDEVALMNDSIVTVSPAQRRRKMLAWLNWRIKTLAGANLPKPK
jgi:hypothetical protein